MDALRYSQITMAFVLSVMTSGAAPLKITQSAEGQEIRRIYDEIFVAYTNCDWRTIDANFIVAAERVSAISETEFDSISCKLDSYMLQLVDKKVVPNFSSLSELADRIETYRAIFEGVGYVELHLRYSGVHLCFTETFFLVILNRYRAAFAGRGEFEYVKYMDEKIAEWKDHINSEGGFLRRYMRKVRKDLSNWAPPHHLTDEVVRQEVRKFAREMECRTGFRPSWLDVEF